jgi:hypothetical protein
MEEAAMFQHFAEGGWGMWALLGVGLPGLATALRYAVTADGRLEGALEAMARAVLCLALSGFFTGVVATGGYLEAHPEAPFAATAFQGVKEATNNLALGFTLLALVHLALAVGRRRAAAKG